MLILLKRKYCSSIDVILDNMRENGHILSSKSSSRKLLHVKASNRPTLTKIRKVLNCQPSSKLESRASSIYAFLYSNQFTDICET
jgi:hypothetical protein